MTNKTFWKNTLIMVVVAVVVGYATAHFVTTERMDDEIAFARLDIANQLTTVASLSEVLSRGGADEVTETVIKDCQLDERTRFDALLGRLNNNLSRIELQEVSRLFDRCAAFYARRKAVMATRFEREVELYEQLIGRFTRLSKSEDTEIFAVAQWRELARFEKDQSQYFDRLVELQGEIITTLLNGKSSASTEIVELLKEVQEVQQMQAYNTVRMSEMRKALPTSL